MPGEPYVLVKDIIVEDRGGGDAGSDVDERARFCVRAEEERTQQKFEGIPRCEGDLRIQSNLRF